MEHDCLACVPKERNLSSLWFSKAASWWVGLKNTLTIFSTSAYYFIQPVLPLRVGGKPRWCNSMGWLHGSCAGLQPARHSALNATLCPPDPSSCSKVLLFGRLLKEPAQLCEHGWLGTAWCSHYSSGQQGLRERAHKQGKGCWRTGRDGKGNFCLFKKELGEGETSDRGGNKRLSSINQSLINLTEWLGNAMLPTEALEFYI